MSRNFDKKTFGKALLLAGISEMLIGAAFFAFLPDIAFAVVLIAAGIMFTLAGIVNLRSGNKSS